MSNFHFTDEGSLLKSTILCSDEPLITIDIFNHENGFEQIGTNQVLPFIVTSNFESTKTYSLIEGKAIIENSTNQIKICLLKAFEALKDKFDKLYEGEKILQPVLKAGFVTEKVNEGDRVRHINYKINNGLLMSVIEVNQENGLICCGCMNRESEYADVWFYPEDLVLVIKSDGGFI